MQTIANRRDAPSVAQVGVLDIEARRFHGTNVVSISQRFL